LIGDAKRVRDPGAVTKRFAAEFEKLVLIALMEDWDERIAASDAACTLQHYL